MGLGNLGFVLETTSQLIVMRFMGDVVSYRSQCIVKPTITLSESQILPAKITSRAIDDECHMAVELGISRSGPHKPTGQRKAARHSFSELY